MHLTSTELMKHLKEEEKIEAERTAQAVARKLAEINERAAKKRDDSSKRRATDGEVRKAREMRKAEQEATQSAKEEERENKRRFGAKACKEKTYLAEA